MLGLVLCTPSITCRWIIRRKSSSCGVAYELMLSSCFLTLGRLDSTFSIDLLAPLFDEHQPVWSQFHKSFLAGDDSVDIIGFVWICEECAICESHALGGRKKHLDLWRRLRNISCHSLLRYFLALRYGQAWEGAAGLQGSCFAISSIKRSIRSTWAHHSNAPSHLFWAQLRTPVTHLEGHTPPWVLHASDWWILCWSQLDLACQLLNRI